MTFWLTNGSSVSCPPEDAPKTDIVCIKWFAHGQWHRIFEGEFYWWREEDSMWNRLMCRCMADEKRNEGRIVIEGGMTPSWTDYQKIMQESK